MSGLHLSDDQAFPCCLHHGTGHLAEFVDTHDLVDAEGREAAIVSVTERKGKFTVYNLEVAGSHTYYAGDAGWWVHNADYVDIYRGMGPDQTDYLRQSGGTMPDAHPRGEPLYASANPYDAGTYPIFESGEVWTTRVPQEMYDRAINNPDWSQNVGTMYEEVNIPYEMRDEFRPFFEGWTQYNRP